MIGGYPLRTFIHLSRFTRDSDFTLRKGDKWNIDKLKTVLPEDYSIEEGQKRDSFG